MINNDAGRKSGVNYEIVEDPFFMTDSQKKRINIKRTMLDFDEQDDVNMDHHKKTHEKENEFANCHLMNEALFKYMLYYRLISIFCLLSLGVSIISVYASINYEHIPIYINHVITLILLVLLALKFNYYQQLQSVKKASQPLLNVENMFDLIILLPHPSTFFQHHNFLLHLLLLLRIIFPLKYLIYSSTFYDSRAYRVISVYGLSSTQHIFFAFKSLIASLAISQILILQCICIVTATHCLYLMSLDSEIPMTFMDCLEVVIVTVPTVGFGEYSLPYLGQRILIFFILVMGLLLNSFIIFIMINELSMSEMEENSYQLQKKISVREELEYISKKYIRESIELVRKKSVSDRDFENEKIKLHLQFKNNYRQLKGLYTSINFVDMDNIFAYFRTSIVLLHKSTQQTQNMVKVFLKALHVSNLKSAQIPSTHSLQLLPPSDDEND